MNAKKPRPMNAKKSSYSQKHKDNADQQKSLGKTETVKIFYVFYIFALFRFMGVEAAT